PRPDAVLRPRARAAPRAGALAARDSADGDRRRRAPATVREREVEACARARAGGGRGCGRGRARRRISAGRCPPTPFRSVDDPRRGPDRLAGASVPTSPPAARLLLAAP